MHVTAPGHQHIELLVTQARTGAPEQTVLPAPGLKKPRGTEPLVHQAIMAAFAGKKSAALLSASFGPAVRAHIRARAKQPTANAPAGVVNVVTCHAREGGEFFGTVDAGGKRHAYAARVLGGKLTSFKVL